MQILYTDRYGLATCTPGTAWGWAPPPGHGATQRAAADTASDDAADADADLYDGVELGQVAAAAMAAEAGSAAGGSGVDVHEYRGVRGLPGGLCRPLEGLYMFVRGWQGGAASGGGGGAGTVLTGGWARMSADQVRGRGAWAGG